MSPDPCNEEPPACALAQETTVLLCAEPEVGLRAPLTRVQSLGFGGVPSPRDALASLLHESYPWRNSPSGILT